MFLSSKFKEKLRKNKNYYTLGVLFIIAVFAWIGVLARESSGFLEVNFFDVGQGDAIFIEVPGGNQILIDGGPDDKILEKLGREMPFWDRSIDMIILTHPEKDHVLGLIEVLKRYKITDILWTGIVRNTSEYEEWIKLIPEEGAAVKIIKAGERIRFTDDIFMDVIYPLENLEGKKIKESNNTSIVSRLVFGSTSFLFTGDMEKSAEYEVLGRGAYLDSDVLKVGHHGSKTSTSDEFLKAVSPLMAVIEVGKNNRYGHPVQEILDRIIENSAKIFRTDLNGDIKIISDGNTLKLAH